MINNNAVAAARFQKEHVMKHYILRLKFCMAYFTSVYFVGITGNSNWFSELRSRKRPSIFRLGKEGRERESFDVNNSL